jgi:tetratricopeptide (TPR) repeat protein
VLAGEPAINTCQAAVIAAAGGKSKVAQNNLALAHAAAGDADAARQWFRRAGEPATANYNYGIAMMATRAYEEAAAAFDAALKADPQFTMAAIRARQARLAAKAEDDQP